MRLLSISLSVVASFVLAINWLLSAAEPNLPTTFPTPINTEPDGPVKALPPEAAASGFGVPDGFQVSVFAAEPEVQNPIAMAWDARGRLWVAENYTYADRTKKFDLSHRDRVLIFADTDGDGRHDKRTVFTDDVQMLTGIEIGNGGVWLMTPPQLVFIPDRDEDDKPDGAPIVMLDGFTPSTDNYHTFANGLKWGPDGWLYGRCGASSPGRIGVPGTPDVQRVPLNGGIWRYQAESRGHAPRDEAAIVPSPPSAGERVRGPNDEQTLQPLADDGRTPHLNSLTSRARDEGTGKDHRAIVEVLCHGTTNPWGMDWSELGEAFFINTVIGHLWHVIPGAHFQRPHSEDPNPHVYELIDQHADHYHWDTGKDWTDSRKVTGEHDRLGGGHAHSGAMIYLGDNWPEQYRGRLMTLNLHGRRINVEQLVRTGSGYVGQHEPDILPAADPWFRGIDLNYGPDGAVYILDWSDTGECHDSTGVHRTSGRIYRVKHESSLASAPVPAPPSAGERTRARGLGIANTPLNLSALNNQQLFSLVTGPEWFARRAIRLIAARPRDTQVTDVAKSLFQQSNSDTERLRALWLLHQTNSLEDEFLLNQTRHPSEHVRAWIVRLLIDDSPLDTIQGQPHPFAASPNEAVLQELIRLAREDDSGLVRLALASALQRIPVERRIELATPLAARDEDADDHNLPLLIWYGLIPTLARSSSEVSGPVTAQDSERPLALARFAIDCRFPVTRRLVARRLAELIDEHPKAIDTLLISVNAEASLQDILNGLTAGFVGRHKVEVPATWKAVQQQVATSENVKLRERVRDLSVLFGDGRALEEVQRVAFDGKAEMASRKAALQTLIDNRPVNLREVCEKLLSVRSLNTVAVRGLASFDDPLIGEKLAQNYRSFYPQERPAVIETLVARPSFAKALLDEMAMNKIDRMDLSAFQARQLRSFGNAALTKQLTDVWGELRDSPADKQQLAAKLKRQFTPETLQAADKSAGRVVFNKLCANCHGLYGHGNTIGPDLTGAGRHNLDYVVDNLVDPSAVVGADYRMSVVVLNDGRVLNGIVSGKTDRTLTLQTAKDRLTLALSDIDELQAATVSLMPEGQLQPLTDAETRDLVSYLMHPTQVPLP